MIGELNGSLLRKTIGIAAEDFSRWQEAWTEGFEKCAEVRLFAKLAGSPFEVVLVPGWGLQTERSEAETMGERRSRFRQCPISNVLSIIYKNLDM